MDRPTCSTCFEFECLGTNEFGGPHGTCLLTGKPIEYAKHHVCEHHPKYPEFEANLDNLPDVAFDELRTYFPLGDHRDELTRKAWKWLRSSQDHRLMHIVFIRDSRFLTMLPNRVIHEWTVDGVKEYRLFTMDGPEDGEPLTEEPVDCRVWRKIDAAYKRS